jgi:hypothetical protein
VVNFRLSKPRFAGQFYVIKTNTRGIAKYTTNVFCSCSSISVMIYGIPDNAFGWVIGLWHITRQPPQNRLAKNIL